MRFAAAALLLCPALAFAQPFHVEESTIESTHRAIQRGETTCREVIAGYVERARAYNGVCTALVTRDGAPVAPARGPVRAGAPLVVSDANGRRRHAAPRAYADYAGKPVELGRMEASQSDPDVQLQYGMVVGIPRSRQVNALCTLNLRGERSVTCQAECDAHPSSGALPAAAPRCARTSGGSPTRSSARPSSTRSTAATPISPRCRCTAPRSRSRTSSTRATCARRAAPTSATRWTLRPQDSTIVAELREKGAIIYAKANLVRVQRRQRQPRRSGKATTRTYGAGAPQHVGRHRLQPLRHDLRDRRIELGIGGLGRREPGHVLDLRGDRRLVPPAGVAQRRRRARDDQGPAAVRRRRSAPTRISIAPAFTAARSRTRRSCSTP